MSVRQVNHISAVLLFLSLRADNAAAQADKPSPKLGAPAKEDPFADLAEPASQEKGGAPAKEDPFADLGVAKPAETPPASRIDGSWRGKFFRENFGFRKEIMSQFDTTAGGHLAASRQSIGFEALKKFSTATETVASLNFQGRLVRRDGFNPVLNDMEGESRRGWAFEYHNVYLDLYNVFNPFLGAGRKGSQLGRFNLRVGRFYVPFGLNLQTDTHGTVLQLSNERNFGFERDWYAGFWGQLNQRLKYDVYYLTGSGYALKYKGQSGLVAARLSLADKYASGSGLEGGVSVIGGERLARPDMGDRAMTLKTERAGIDGRVRKPVTGGLLTFMSEVSGGRDARDAVFTQLHQAEYLHSSRRWGGATQYRRFTRDGFPTDASLASEVTWYFRNDVGNSNLHWVKLNVERRIERARGSPDTVVTLQYYFYR